MNFNELDLLQAQKEGIISVEIFNKLIEYLKSSSEKKSVSNNSDANITNNNSKFNIENFLYYFGAFIIVSTMVWYLGSIMGYIWA